ncbi:MAG: helix-turn-helix domain-containing protein, partial [Candidatus Cybelea sp.]
MLLRQHRIAAGLSQEALAERARMSAHGVSALERGYRRTPQRETFALLARALALSEEQRREFEAAAEPLGLGHLRASAAYVTAGISPESGISSLPLALTSFIGREAETAEIATLAREHRLVTLTGAGGVGKTQTALHVGTALGNVDNLAFCFVGLATVGDPSLVVTALAATLSVQEVPNRPLLETLIAYLKNKALLLILDNCEHVITEAASVSGALLAGCPCVRILATSREPLRAAGEYTYRLPSLSVPSSVALFADRARAVDYRFALDDEDALTVAEICRRLDGIPLAIELAAARVSVLPVKVLAEMIDNRFQILTNGERTALPRQQTMRGVIDWSYDLLCPQEQRVFERLSAFAGGCTLEAATVVCTDEGSADLDMFGPLSSLVDKSLVVTDFDGGEPRYGLLESFREYAREKLATRGETKVVAHRHAIAYLAIAERLTFGYTMARSRERLAEAKTELDNWREALDWTLGARADIHLGQRLAGTLRPVWTSLALVEGRSRVRAALKLVDHLTPIDVVAQLEYSAATIEFGLGETAASFTAAEKALTRYREIGDAHGIARAQLCVGQALLYVGGTAKAKPLLQEALEAARALGDRMLLASALQRIAYARSVDGDLAGAHTDYTKALTLFRDLGAERAVPSISLDLAASHFLAGDVEAALREGAEGLRSARALRHLHIVALGLATVSVFLTASARYEEARANAREVIDLAHEHEWYFILALA